MKTTLQDIAKLCDVSRETVSRVMRNPEHPSCSKEKRKQILKKAQDLQYVPNRVAQNLKRGKTNMLALVIPYNDPGVMDNIQQFSRKLGFGTTVQFTPKPDEYSEEQALQAALEQRVDGIIWMPVNPYDVHTNAVKLIEQSGRPVVTLQHKIQGLEQADVVMINWENAIRQAITHLKECGYEKIVNFISYTQIRRWDDFDRIAKEENVTFESLEGPPQEFTRIITDYLESQTVSIGFFGLNWSAIHALRAAKATGWRIPLDAGIVMVGDPILGAFFPVSEITSPSLTSIRIPGETIAKTAVKLLVDRLQNSLNGQGIEKLIPVTLTKRESTNR